MTELMFTRQKGEGVEIDTKDAHGDSGPFWDSSSLSEGLESALIAYPKKNPK